MEPVIKGDDVRCGRCMKLLCKRLPDGSLDIRWRDLQAVVSVPATIHCPRCHEPNEVPK